MDSRMRLPASPATFLNAFSSDYQQSMPSSSKNVYTNSRSNLSQDMSRSVSALSLETGSSPEEVSDQADYANQADPSSSSLERMNVPSSSTPSSPPSEAHSPTEDSLFEPSAGSSSLGSSFATSPSIHAIGENETANKPVEPAQSRQRRRSKHQLEPPATFTSTPPGQLSHARSILEHQAASLLSAARRLREEEITWTEFRSAQNTIVATLQAGGKLVWTGVGKSGIIAQKLCATSLSLGMPSTYLDPMAALHGDLGLLNGSNNAFRATSSSSTLPTPAGDVVIALSHSGSSPELVALLPHLRLRGVKLMALTARKDSGLATAAQESGGNWIDCRTAGGFADEDDQSSTSMHSSLMTLSSATAGSDEADPRVPAPSSSTTTALAMGDSLVLSCARLLGLGVQDFGKNHPGGSLGKRMMAEMQEKVEQQQVSA